MDKSIIKLEISYHLKEFETEIGAIFEDEEELFDINEQIIIDRNKGSLIMISQIATCSYSKCEYKDFDEINSLLDDIGEVKAKYVDSDKLYDNLKEQEYYTIKVLYDNGEKQVFTGKYSRLYLPQNYLEIVENIKFFIDDHNEMMNVFMPRWEYMSDILEDEYYYIGVTFDYGDKIYYYKTKRADIRIGDTVLVPANNTETVAYVESIDIFHKDNTPIPFNKTKDIIDVIEDDE